MPTNKSIDKKSVFTTSQMTLIPRSTLLFSLIPLNYSNPLILIIYIFNDPITLIPSLHDRIYSFRPLPRSDDRIYSPPCSDRDGVETTLRTPTIPRSRLRLAPVGSGRLYAPAPRHASSTLPVALDASLPSSLPPTHSDASHRLRFLPLPHPPHRSRR